MFTTGSLLVPKASEKTVKFSLEQWFLTEIMDTLRTSRKATVPLSRKATRIHTSVYTLGRDSALAARTPGLVTLSVNDR